MTFAEPCRRVGTASTAFGRLRVSSRATPTAGDEQADDVRVALQRVAAALGRPPVDRDPDGLEEAPAPEPGPGRDRLGRVRGLHEVGFDGIVTRCVFAWEEKAMESARFMRTEIHRYVDKYWGAGSR